MGAWGTGNFENDTASDWVWDFEENPTAVFLKATIDNALEQEEYLDSQEACEALAAVEMIAAIKGKPSTDFPELESTDLNALAPFVGEELINTAIRFMERILNKRDNELYELWADSDEMDNWLGVEQALLNRL